MPRFMVPDNRKAQKNVQSSTVVVGDWIYRAKDGVDYLMMVDAIGEDVHEGTSTDVFLFSGDVYRAQGVGAGAAAAFLGDMEALGMGRGKWGWPKTERITIACSSEDADYEIP
jgi:hypothetical protein